MSAGGKPERDGELYTIVLGGLYQRRRSYLIVDGDGGYERRVGFPPAELLRGEIPFEALPRAARETVFSVYREEWGL